MKHLQSKFRLEFWLHLIVQSVGMFILFGFMILQTIKYTDHFFYSPGFWIPFAVCVAFLPRFLKFIFADLKRIRIFDNTLEIQYLVTRKVETISKDDIHKLRSKWSKGSVGQSVPTKRYKVLEMHLAQERIVEISAMHFSNFNEISACLLKMKRSASAQSP